MGYFIYEIVIRSFHRICLSHFLKFCQNLFFVKVFDAVYKTRSEIIATTMCCRSPLEPFREKLFETDFQICVIS